MCSGLFCFFFDFGSLNEVNVSVSMYMCGRRSHSHGVFQSIKVEQKKIYSSNLLYKKKIIHIIIIIIDYDSYSTHISICIQNT